MKGIRLYIDEELLDKFETRKTLDQIYDYISNCHNEMSNSEILKFLDECEESLVSKLSDVSEVNRSKTCRIIHKLLERGFKTEKMLNYAIPVIFHRIGKNPVIEECEENRLELLNLIEQMIDVYSVDIQIYISDLCSIFVVCLNDKFPKVVLKTCDCIRKLATITSQKFRKYSNSFTTPLLKCISKHKLKVRVKSIATLEYILIYGDVQEYAEITKQLTKCIQDIPQVRQTLLSLGFSLCTKMKDRYSFWALFLPLVLFGLRDDNIEIRETAEDFWKKIGAQYEREQKDIQSESDSPNVMEETDPGPSFGSLNFSAGCCSLIRRGFYRMCNDIDLDLRDWQVDVRLRAVRLLTVCVAGLHDECLQYSSKIINQLVFSVNDNDPRITAESLLCAEYLGYVVPPNLFIPLIKPSLLEENEGSLRIFSACVRSAPPEHLQNSLSLFVDVLRLSNIKNNLSNVELDEILRIMQRLFEVCKFEEFEAGFLFTLFHIVHVKSLCDSDTEKEYAFSVLEAASRSFKSDSVESFISDNLITCLCELRQTPPWSSETEQEISVFYFLSKHKAFGNYLQEASDILEMKLDHAMFPLVTFSILQALMDVLRSLFNSKNNRLVEKWSVYLIKEFILQMFHSSHGRTGESLRLAAISSLNSILKCSRGDKNKKIFAALEPCLKKLSNLTFDSMPETRLSVCSFIELYHDLYAKLIDTKSFFAHIKLLVDRLNDKDIKVRRTAARALLSSLTAFSEWKNKTEETKELMSSIFIFLIEDDTSVQQDIMDVVRKLGEACPEHLQSLYENPEYQGLLENLPNIKLSICQDTQESEDCFLDVENLKLS